MAIISSQFTEIMQHLDEAIDSALEIEVAEELKAKVRDSVISNVYDVYTPKRYKRREDEGGLSDIRNYITKVTVNHTLELENTTSDNGYTRKKNRRITNVVETGKGYTWYSPGARPFMEETFTSTVTESDLGAALNRGIAARGFLTEAGDLDF